MAINTKSCPLCYQSITYFAKLVPGNGAGTLKMILFKRPLTPNPTCSLPTRVWHFVDATATTVSQGHENVYESLLRKSTLLTLMQQYLVIEGDSEHRVQYAKWTLTRTNPSMVFLSIQHKSTFEMLCISHPFSFYMTVNRKSVKTPSLQLPMLTYLLISQSS